jgi:deoxyadenosine/deoxycytidine kinase
VLTGNLEHRWQSIVCHRVTKSVPILSICGPSGVGKTTIIRALANTYHVFTETTDGNPHLNNLLKENNNFNAAANQRWFLDHIGKHISSANQNWPLILDQDPAAIVLAYAKMFVDGGKMKNAQYTALLKRLLKIEESLQNWSCPRTVLFLDAPAEVLRQRTLRRSGKSITPSLEWFEQVRSHFVQLSPHFPDVCNISTEKFSPEQVTARARALIESKINND